MAVDDQDAGEQDAGDQEGQDEWEQWRREAERRARRVDREAQRSLQRVFVMQRARARRGLPPLEMAQPEGDGQAGQEPGGGLLEQIREGLEAIREIRDDFREVKELLEEIKDKVPGVGAWGE